MRVASNIQGTYAPANSVVRPLRSDTADVKKAVKLPVAPRALVLTALLRPVRSASPPKYGPHVSPRSWDHKAESRTVPLCYFKESLRRETSGFSRGVIGIWDWEFVTDRKACRSIFKDLPVLSILRKLSEERRTQSPWY